MVTIVLDLTAADHLQGSHWTVLEELNERRST
jgi:hypothetical protein